MSVVVACGPVVGRGGAGCDSRSVATAGTSKTGRSLLATPTRFPIKRSIIDTCHALMSCWYFLSGQDEDGSTFSEGALHWRSGIGAIWTQLLCFLLRGC